MSFFNKKDELEQEANRVSKEAISCIISEEMHIKGEIRFKGKARIDGTVEGDIQGEYLVLSESGRIIGDLELGALICHGSIEGTIKSKLVTAHSTAAIKGRLTSGSLTVEPGAILEGEIHASRKQKETDRGGQTVPPAKIKAPKVEQEGETKKTIQPN